jgi:hypothetical protein
MFSQSKSSPALNGAPNKISGRDSSVGTATHYGLGRSGDRIPVGGAKFSASVHTGPGAHPASCTIDTWSFPGVNRPGRGVDNPSPFSVPGLSSLYRENLYLYFTNKINY